MDNIKDDKYYISKIINDIEFCLRNLTKTTLHEFDSDEILSSAISFKFVQISENVKKLSPEIFNKYKNIPWHKISGLRNRIVHDYGSVELDIIYYTVKQNLPDLLVSLSTLLNQLP